MQEVRSNSYWIPRKAAKVDLRSPTSTNDFLDDRAEPSGELFAIVNSAILPPLPFPCSFPLCCAVLCNNKREVELWRVRKVSSSSLLYVVLEDVVVCVVLHATTVYYGTTL